MADLGGFYQFDGFLFECSRKCKKAKSSTKISNVNNYSFDNWIAFSLVSNQFEMKEENVENVLLYHNFGLVYKINHFVHSNDEIHQISIHNFNANSNID